MEEMKIPQRARAAMTDGALQTAGKGMLGVFDQAYNVFNRDPGPYGAVRGNSTTTTPETTPPAAQQDQASITIAQFSLLMDKKLKPLQDEVKSVKTAVNSTNDEVGAIRTALGQQMQATSDLKQRVGNIEYSSDWYWKNLDGRLKSIEGGIVNEAEKAVAASMTKMGVDVGQLQQEVVALQQRDPAPTGSKTKTSKQMSEKEQIREICDKIEPRFPEGVAEPAKDEAAKQLVEQVLNTIMTDMQGIRTC